MFKRPAVILAACAAAAVLGASSALAAANTQGDLFTNNAWCAGAQDKTQPAGGFVNFHRPDAATVHVEVHLKDAAPDATYTLSLYRDFCTFDASLGTVTTNDNGVANLNTDAAVPAGSGQFFVFGSEFSGSGFGDVESVQVTLPS